MSKRMSLEEFIEKSNKVYNNKYDYSITKQFKSQRDKVLIKCPEHGKIEVIVGNHLIGKSGCRYCSGNVKRDTKSFLMELESKGFLFKDHDYSLVDYKNTNSKVLIIDKKFDSKHSITPKSLLKGKRCSSSNLTNGYLDFEDASNSSNTEKLKTRYQTMQNTIKYAKSLEEAGTSINEGQGASFNYSNLIFKDDDSTTVTNIREQGVDDINNPNKGDMTTTEREAIKVGADRYGGGTYMGTDKDGGFDVYTDAIKRPRILDLQRPDSLPTSTTDLKGNPSTATSNSTSTATNNLTNAQRSSDPNNQMNWDTAPSDDSWDGGAGNYETVKNPGSNTWGRKYVGNKGGLVSKPKKKKAKAYKRGGLASKKK